MTADVDVPEESPEPTTEPAPNDDRPGWVAMLRRRPALGGIALAVLFWWKSLSPTLMPRTPVAQTMISAVCVSFAVMVGTFLGWLVHRTLARLDWRLRDDIRRGLWIAIGVAGALVFVTGLFVWTDWQNEQRDLFGMDHVSTTGLMPMVPVTAVLTVVLIALGRIVWRGVRAVDRWMLRRLRRTGATIATVLVILLIAWDTLGREGRNFVTRITTEEQLKAFHGDDADVQRPVRVYAGLNSADNAEDRAALAVRDLERAGGFDRELLVVTTVTGTGWVDPDAATAIEHLRRRHGHDRHPVLVPAQLDLDARRCRGRPAGRIRAFNAVSARWWQLPADDRPQLLVFGQSLGSMGAEAAFAGYDGRTSVANIVNRTEGALFTGPTNANAMWGQIVAARDHGSTAWLPVYRDGESVRFANRNEEMLAFGVDDGWTGPHILYVQHPSDPVTFWNMETMWSEPEWIQDPKGYDIPSRASRFPFVTWAQGVADLAAGFGAKPGYGHDYSTAFVAGWAAVAPPDGWTIEDTQRLQVFLDRV